MSGRHLAEIAVVGGGPAGLAAALALARGGREVALVAPPPPADARATALLDGSVGFLRALGVWPHLAAHATALTHLRIVEDTGSLVRAPDLFFSAREIGLAAFGQMVPNAVLSATLLQAISREARIRRFGSLARDVRTAEGSATIALESGEEIGCRLLVAADGRGSVSREAAGIAVRRWSYPQTALVVNVVHERPHGNVSTEFHTRAGPFTLAPLAGNRSGIVCAVRPETAERLAALDDAMLGTELTARSHRLLGALVVDGPRGVFPVRGQAARRFAANRVALVGEAAHVIPPIGAQGLNLGMRDARDIAAAVAAGGNPDPGSAAVLQAYDAARRGDVAMRTAAVDLLNRSLLSGLLPVQLGRGLGQIVVDGAGPLRRRLMQVGMMPGRAGDLLGGPEHATRRPRA